MEAKLKIGEFDCYNKSYCLSLRKEESRDAVVPDTQPDIAEVLYCGGRLIIRSKDVSAGRIKVEAIVPADVLYKGEDGRLYSVELSIPVFLSAEDDKISDGALATAKLELYKLEARALNPRKIMVRAEIAAELAAYDSDKIALARGVEDCEHIKSRIGSREISIISAVTEKSFALTDEINLPPAAEGVKNIIYTGCSCSVDDIKPVGTKLIVKGRVRNRLIYMNANGELCYLEPSTDYSQIIELGKEAGSGTNSVWIIPSGAYCSLSPENEGKISLEMHLVAQVICRSKLTVEYIDDVYSNCFCLLPEWSEVEIEQVNDGVRLRESVRQLFETSRALSEVVYSGVRAESAVFRGGKMLLPLSFTAICLGNDGLWNENRRCEIELRLPGEKGEYFEDSVEISDWSLLPVPGGMELRLEISAKVILRQEDKIKYVSSICFDEENPSDNSLKPSLTLLRVKENDDIWALARENCSSPEAILSANGVEDIRSAAGKLILIPKTY